MWRDILNFSVDTLQRSHHLSGDFHLIQVIQVIQVIQPICTFPTIEIKAFVEKGKNCSPFFTRKAFYLDYNCMNDKDIAIFILFSTAGVY